MRWRGCPERDEKCYTWRGRLGAVVDKDRPLVFSQKGWEKGARRVRVHAVLFVGDHTSDWISTLSHRALPGSEKSHPIRAKANGHASAKPLVFSLKGWDFSDPGNARGDSVDIQSLV